MSEVVLVVVPDGNVLGLFSWAQLCQCLAWHPLPSLVST